MNSNIWLAIAPWFEMPDFMALIPRAPDLESEIGRSRLIVWNSARSS